MSRVTYAVQLILTEYVAATREGLKGTVQSVLVRARICTHKADFRSDTMQFHCYNVLEMTRHDKMENK